MAYGQRTDLNKMAPTAAPGQTYGEAGAQKAAQRAVPMGASAQPAPPSATPGQYGPFDRATERPNEPITAGANFGPGPNAMQAGIPIPTGDQALAELRAIYAMYPNDDLADLIDSATREGL